MKLVEKSANGEFLWECECECGKHIIVPALQLEKHIIKDCGCGKGEKPKYKDIANRRKGKLTALYPTDRRDSKGSVYWKCRCDCGNEIEMTESDFVHGSSVSCGCVRRQRWEEVLPTEYLTFVNGTCVEWIEKRKTRSDNTSGFRGVSKSSSGRYRASIGLQGEKYDLGTYKTFEEAVDVRLYVEKYLHDGFVQCWMLWNKKANDDELWAVENPFYYEVVKDNRSFSISSPISEPISFQY